MSKTNSPIPINQCHTESASTQSLAAATLPKDSHGSSNPPPAGQKPQQYPRDVRVFIGDPPCYLFSIPEWEARDRIRRREARVINTGTRRRGIQLVPRPKVVAIHGGLARLDQVEGLPVVGPAIKLFYGKPEKKAA